MLQLTISKYTFKFYRKKKKRERERERERKGFKWNIFLISKNDIYMKDYSMHEEHRASLELKRPFIVYI